MKKSYNEKKTYNKLCHISKRMFKKKTIILSKYPDLKTVKKYSKIAKLKLYYYYCKVI